MSRPQVLEDVQPSETKTLVNDYIDAKAVKVTIERQSNGNYTVTAEK